MKVDYYPKIRLEYHTLRGELLWDEWEEHEWFWAWTTFQAEIAFNLIRSLHLYYYWDEEEWILLQKWEKTK